MDSSEQESIISMLTLLGDFANFQFKYQGYDCLIKRYTSRSFKTLCGYVGLTDKHPLYGKDRINIWCHGGITFMDYGDGINYSKYNDNGEKLFWIGFDCSHFGDIKYIDDEMIILQTPELVAEWIFDMVHQLNEKGGN